MFSADYILLTWRRVVMASLVAMEFIYYSGLDCMAFPMKLNETMYSITASPTVNKP